MTSPLKINKSHDQSHQYVVVGQSVEIELPVHPGTQRPWTWESGFDVLEAPSPAQVCKHGAMIFPTQRWRFSIRREGTTMLRLRDPAQIGGLRGVFEVKFTAHKAPPR